MSDYETLFEARGSSYQRAMELAPAARDEEFLQLLDHASLAAGVVVADVPSGGGYLERYLPEGVRHWTHEPCSAFLAKAHPSKSSRPLLPFPWPARSVDVVVSLAGVHHLDDKSAFLAECRRVARPAGQLVLSDVDECSPITRFLDDFVGKFNSTGHHGYYLSDSEVARLRDSGWAVRSDSPVPLRWRFKERREMTEFFRLLFDLRGIGPAELEGEIRDRLGVHEKPDGSLDVHWELRTVVATADSEPA
ncbi:class I SAM-dependent methyltransferase [Thioalkalivibrio sp. AKL10]|uniref:class I SAM-dependent methyltransferase n=1 Tax=Thioalkalivibrio sp. AKL10 TaxID=1158158 RepID=UPI000371EFBD|nr:methyltransferase domain-containing protein [Thioalkalivibrio sp. AKL10]